MLPVNIAHGHEATVSPFSVAVKRQAIASTVYSSTLAKENTKKKKKLKDSGSRPVRPVLRKTIGLTVTILKLHHTS